MQKKKEFNWLFVSEFFKFLLSVTRLTRTLESSCNKKEYKINPGVSIFYEDKVY
jgi:hypothetical protein